MKYNITDARIEGLFATEDRFGFKIGWSGDIGFGEILFIKEGSDISIDSECMTKDFVKKVLTALVDKAQLVI